MQILTRRLFQKQKWDILIWVNQRFNQSSKMLCRVNMSKCLLKLWCLIKVINICFIITAKQASLKWGQTEEAMIRLHGVMKQTFLQPTYGICIHVYLSIQKNTENSKDGLGLGGGTITENDITFLGVNSFLQVWPLVKIFLFQESMKQFKRVASLWKEG